MSTVNKILTYRWFIDTLRKHPRGLTRSEINDKWLENEDLSRGVEMSLSTFKRMKDECFSAYKVLIECDKHNRYYISNKEDILRDRVHQYMLRSVAVGKVLSDSERIYDRILIEPMPSDEFIEVIITAMSRNVKIELIYQEYGADDEELIIAEPYALKTYHHRWYVLAKLPDGRMRIVSLDRVNKVTMTKEKFVFDETFDASYYFSEFYAVRLDRDREPQDVIIRAHLNERFIIDRQPIHCSQKKIAEGDNYADFKYHLRPTFDFVTYLESQGRFVEVLEPRWLREELVRVHTEAIERNKIS